jgi:hypothetical protein
VSREQRRAPDEVLRKAPQPFGPVPVEKMREGFAAFVGSFPVAAGVQSAPEELAGRPALVVEREVDTRPGTILYFHGGDNVFGSALAYRLSQSASHQVLAGPAAGDS